MTHSDPRIVPVVLAGGSGTRLWPLSSERRPKQFQAIAGETSMLRQTLDRVQDTARFAAPIIVGNAAHEETIAAELKLAGIVPSTVVLEPFGRNTAPAIALAALFAQKHRLGDILFVMPSDHVIGRPDCLRDALDVASRAARHGSFVTFGIAPSGPETSYGYIKRGEPAGDGAYSVARFVEKPARGKAEEMLAEGGYFWNSGMFMFPVAALLDELRRIKPEMLAGCETALGAADIRGTAIRPEPAAFAALESISIDYALMEHTSRAAVVPADPQWSDVGSWTAVWEVSRRDKEQNVALGDVMLRDVSNAYVRSEGAVTAVLGLSDVIVVNTADGVIVAAKSHAQDIRHVAEALRKRGEASRH